MEKDSRKEADNLRNNGHGKEAAQKYLELAKNYQKLGQKSNEADCVHMAGVSYKVENNIPEAMKYFDQATSLYQEVGSKFGVGRVKTDVGITYAYAGDFKKAVEGLHQAVRELEGQDDLAALGIAEAKLGYNYFKLGKFEEAEEWFAKGLAHVRVYGSWFFELTALGNWAEMDFALARFSNALTKLWASRGILAAIGEDDNQKRRIAQIFGGIGHCYLELENKEFAIEYFQKSLDLLGKMSKDVAGVVYEDIQTKRFLESLKSKFPNDYSRLTIPSNFN